MKAIREILKRIIEDHNSMHLTALLFAALAFAAAFDGENVEMWTVLFVVANVGAEIIKAVEKVKASRIYVLQIGADGDTITIPQHVVDAICKDEEKVVK